jgi:hypothetical protein
METTITETGVYSWTELSDEAKEHAIESNRDRYVFDEIWHEHVIDGAKIIGDIIGIDIDAVWFSHSCSQGDGACFEGRYEYKVGALKAIKSHAPLDTDLHDIAKSLQEIQRRNFYGLSATCKHRGHYNHSGCMIVDLHDNQEYGEWTSEDESDLIDTLRLFADWIFDRIKDEYEYATSDDNIRESLQDNRFLESGEVYD